jgi:hypothetical protein
MSTKTELIILPSCLQIGDNATLECVLEKDRLGSEVSKDHPAIGIPCSILAVHFYPGKVKYDLELQFAGSTSRIYNVDSDLVRKD